MSDATVTPLPINDQAWQQGYLAGRRGLPAVANPYRAGSERAEAWFTRARLNSDTPGEAADARDNVADDPLANHCA